jgi:peroxiredoxin Q/BCP
MKALSELGVELIGVSGDAVRTQGLFKKAHNLNFSLLADEKGEVAKAFGVPTGKGGTVKQEIEGKQEELVRALTIKRWTFVIDKAGKIAYKNSEVKPAEDSKAVLEAIRKLKE